MSLKRLVVIGAGAVGGSIGGLLAEAGFPVVLVARGRHGEKIRSDGLTVRFPKRTVTVCPTCVDRIDSVDWCDGDVALLATKLNDAENVMDELVERAGGPVPVVCASNGMQGERWANSRFETVLSMLVWMPATHLEPGEILIYGDSCPGVLDVGPSTGEFAARIGGTLCDWIGAAGFDSVYRDDIQRWKYAKWITNLGNAAQAMVTDDWKSVAAAARDEGERVLFAVGVARVPTVELLDRTTDVKLQPIDGVSRPGGSTWQSLQRDKPLETPWIEGAMADLADELGLSAPVNRFLDDASFSPRELTAGEVFDAVG